MAMAKNGTTATPRIIEIVILISLKPWVPGLAREQVARSSPAIAAGNYDRQIIPAEGQLLPELEYESG
jgi:hypothetical protein